MIEVAIKKKLQFANEEGWLEINKTIEEKTSLVLFGKSGAGKTTFLRMMAGLTDPALGRIVVQGETWFDKNSNINLPPQQRSIGFVFQDYALFPNMTVKENLQYAQGRKENSSVLNEVLELFGLKGLESRKPDQLSGGQKQRTAFARALIRKPSLLLLDEPLSALDNSTRNDLQNRLLEIQKDFGFTTIMVSHEMGEIAKIGKEIWLMENGKVVDQGSPLSVFSKGKISGKVKIIGEVINISKEDVVFVLTVVTGNTFVKVVATEHDIKSLSVGDKVMVVSKAFNPLILKL
jgi:molybdate transport system ATP-binding protein